MFRAFPFPCPKKQQVRLSSFLTQFSPTTLTSSLSRQGLKTLIGRSSQHHSSTPLGFLSSLFLFSGWRENKGKTIVRPTAWAEPEKMTSSTISLPPHWVFPSQKPELNTGEKIKHNIRKALLNLHVYSSYERRKRALFLYRCVPLSVGPY